jgi:Xaa-Pro aminopeptidase
LDHALRRAGLAEKVSELSIDAVLITRLPNVRYLTGFTGSNGQVLVGRRSSVFFTDGRYTEQSRNEVPDLDGVTYLDGFDPALANTCAELGLSSLGFEAHEVTVERHRRMSGSLEGVELVAVGELVERARWAKDAEELALLRQAQAITDAAFTAILDLLAVGVTEVQVAMELEGLLRREGAEAMAFDPIVAFGESAAEPHHEAGRRSLEEGDVIKLDLGAVCGGYHSDMTRTVAFGEPPPELKKIHDVVREAQQAGIDAVEAGVTGRDVDRVSREVIEAAGYGEAFVHGLGHGVGLEIHEGPNLGRRFGDELPVGAVVTVEPGVYLPGLGGVRIEDMVEVLPGGCRVIGTSPRDLIEL